MADENGPVGSGTNPAPARASAASASPSPAPAGSSTRTTGAKSPAGRPSAGPARPGPTIHRAPGASLDRDPTRGGSQGGSGANRPAGKVAARAAPSGPAMPAPPRSPARSTPKRLQELHATAARRLGLPELAISTDEAAELQASMDAMAELTGWTPSGPTWVWIGVAWTLFSIYAGRLFDIRARKMAELAASAPAPARPAPPQSAPIATGSAAIGAAVLNQGTVSVPPAVPKASAGTDIPLPDAVLTALMNGMEIPEGSTPGTHAAPSTTLDERMDLRA